MNTRQLILLSAAALLPLTVAPLGAAHAQATAGSDIALEEIVVTARKTEERLQDAPLAVSVVTSQRID